MEFLIYIPQQWNGQRRLLVLLTASHGTICRWQRLTAALPAHSIFKSLDLSFYNSASCPLSTSVIVVHANIWLLPFSDAIQSPFSKHRAKALKHTMGKDTGYWCTCEGICRGIRTRLSSHRTWRYHNPKNPEILQRRAEKRAQRIAKLIENREAKRAAQLQQLTTHSQVIKSHWSQHSE
jgi:hypothetical protein